MSGEPDILLDPVLQAAGKALYVRRQLSMAAAPVLYSARDWEQLDPLTQRRWMEQAATAVMAYQNALGMPADHRLQALLELPL
jgi:hypothetical protein